MSQLSFKEWMQDVKNRQRVAEGILTRRALRENYSDKDWEAAKFELSIRKFPDNFKATASKSITSESHEAGKETHALLAWEYNEDIDDFPLKWRVTYCPTCKKTITKYGVITNELLGTASRKWFIRRGNVVTDEEPEEEPKTRQGRQEFEQVLDGYTTLGGDLDG